MSIDEVIRLLQEIKDLGESGKTTVMTALILHFALFNESFNVAVLANKAATAREILHRIQ